MIIFVIPRALLVYCHAASIPAANIVTSEDCATEYRSLADELKAEKVKQQETVEDDLEYFRNASLEGVAELDAWRAPQIVSNVSRITTPRRRRAAFREKET